MGALFTTWVGRPAFWAVAITVLAGVPLASGLSRDPPPPVALSGVTAELALVRPRGEPVDRASLEGRAWVVAFVDPRCPGCTSRALDALETVGRHSRQLGPALGLLAVSLGPLPATGLEAPAQLGPPPWRLAGGAHAQALLEQLSQGRADDAQNLTTGRSVALLDGRMRLRALYEMDSSHTKTLLRDISLLINRDNQFP